MTAPIVAFVGNFRWLSNFHPSPVQFDGIEFPTVEHAYQAAKSLDRNFRFTVARQIRPGEAKRLGRHIRLRPDWEQVKEQVMLGLLRQKFAHPFLADLLVATGDAELVEGNTWGDTYWGVCRGQGRNRLGQLLMQVRAELVSKG